MLKKNSLWFLFIAFISTQANAQPLTLDAVLESARVFFPYVLQQQEKASASKSEVVENRGVFDTKLKSEFSGDLTGYYDGLQTKTYLESRIPTSGNADIFAGYRKSFGTYPIYEGLQETLDQGEIFGGIRLELLRNFGLDENRLKVSIAQKKYEIEKNKLHFQKLKAQEDAAKAYWDWVASGFILKTYENLYKIALDRNEAIQKRIDRGDLARIFGVENMQNVLQRKSDLQNAQQVFENNAQQLSIYFRTNNGTTSLPLKSQLPESFETKIIKPIITMSHDLIKRRPEIKVIEFEQNIIREQIQFSKNQTLPSLDLNSQFKKDYGNGPMMYRGTETEVMLNFEFPFQNRKAKGLESRFQSLLNAIEYEKNLMEDQIKAKFSQNINTLTTTQDILQNLEQEIVLAQKLQEAEIKRWKNGDSDFFLINLREQTTARSQIQWIKTGLQLQKTFAEYSNLTLSYPGMDS